MLAKLKGMIAAAGVLAATLLPGALHARPLDEILSSGVLRVGIETDLAPLGSFDDNNEVVGFDVDVATKLAEKLGVKLEKVNILGPDRIPFVSSGKIDFTLGALTRTAERAKVVDFTAPLHTESLAVLTLKGKPFKHWKDLNDENVTLVQVRGTTPVEFIQANLPKAKLLLLDSNADVVRSLAQGRGDAMIEVLDFFNDLRAQFQADWHVLESPVEVYYCSIGVAKGNSSLKDWLNIALFEMHNNGWVNETWSKWFKGPMIFDVKASPYF
ncbi:transporter substrate-binding domain-containing protein [Ensifer aridi]|uniref:transporter substrate-binding domain-containing protein n=1 Tax=Ensifer aridi TaxID=1708715 RepID=UPI0004185062|nr:transporter substrate-binding domain-containing protein [Ensifer aridi]